EPWYQWPINNIGIRGTPDVSYNADPNSGYSIYTSTPYNGRSGWLSVGGTSAGTPQWAALIAIADQGRALAGQGSLDGPGQTLPPLYAMDGSNFHDITSGNNGFPTWPGYDLVTGRGSPYAQRVVQALLSVTASGKLSSVPVSPASKDLKASAALAHPFVLLA